MELKKKLEHSNAAIMSNFLVYKNSFHNFYSSFRNIVNYIGLLTDSDFAYIIMEFCAGGSFRNFLQSKGTISEAGTKVVFRQLAKALGYLNQHQIIHRDLKPDNILMTDQRNYSIKVCKI